MKQSGLLLLPLIFLSACTTTDKTMVTNLPASQILDLSKPEQKDLLDQYWIKTRDAHPVYPVSAVKKKQSGCVELLVAIDTDGKPQNYSIKRSNPNGVFDKAAAAAVAKWRYTKAATNENAQPVLITTQLLFSVERLDGEEYAQKLCNFS